MPDFTTLLPNEILSAILSHLDQRDCLRCMCVSHRWYNTIPEHMKDVWSSVQIAAASSFSKPNQRLLHCLSLYARKVQIMRMEEYSACQILEILGDLNCAITSIDIENSGEDYYDYVVGENMLYRNLGPFSTTLKDLTLLDQPSDISPVHLLRNLPALTHLTLLYDRSALAELERFQPYRANDMIEFSSNIVFLNVDSALLYHRGIMALLPLCPQLRALIVMTQYRNLHGIDLTERDFGTILDLCPRLRFVTWTFQSGSYRAPYDKRFQQWNALAMAPEQSTQVGIRELELDGNIAQLEAALPLLAGSEQTLEYLEISNVVEDDGRELQGLGFMQFPKLKCLKAREIELTSMNWVRLVRSCKSMEHLQISNNQWPVQENINPIIVALSNLEHTQSLLLSIGLQLANVGHPDICRNFQPLSRSIHLQSLSLQPMCVSRQGLLGLCDISSLQELYISVGNTHQHCLQSDEWVSFAEKLALVNGGLRSLSLEGITKLTDDVMECFGRVKQLSDLAIYHAPDITDTGVDLFLNSQGKELSMVRKLRIRGCPRVLRGESNTLIRERVYTSL